MSFSDPAFLLLLVFLPIFAYRLFGMANRDRNLRYSSLALLSRLSGNRGRIKYGIVVVCYLLAWTFAVIALAGPRSSRQYEKRLSEGVDMILALDVSGSMQAVDNRQALQVAMRHGYYYDRGSSLSNRLQYAKKFTADFIAKRPNDRIGLVVFAGYSFTKCPLTFDHSLLVKMLDSASFRSVKEQSTAIGLAIANGVNRLRTSRAKSKILILITDGENTAGSIDPFTAAEIAKTMGIKVYTIGVGSETPLVPANRGKPYYVKTARRNRIDVSTLKKIASMTGGEFFRARKGGSLSDIFRRIDSMEKSIIERKVFSEYTEHYQVWLLISLLFLVGGTVLRYLVLRVYI